MAEILELTSVPKVARNKNLVAWFGTPDYFEVSRLGHRIVSQDTYEKSTKLPIEITFTLPVAERFTDELRKAKDNMVYEACRLVKKRRHNQGILTSYQVERDVITYTTLRDVSLDAFQEYISHPDGGYFKLITAMVFSAFCLEAFTNHIGRLYYPYWCDYEKGRTPEDKLRMILVKVGYSADFSKRPFQTFARIFHFRNNIAHGKTERVFRIGEEKLLVSEDPPTPYSEWESLVSTENAERFIQDTDEIVRVVWTHAGFNSYHFPYGKFSWKIPVDRNTK